MAAWMRSRLSLIVPSGNPTIVKLASPRTRAQRKPLELLKALVALGGESIPTEKLTDSFWPDTDGDQASSALSTTLYRLRKLIGPDALILRDGRLTCPRRNLLFCR